MGAAVDAAAGEIRSLRRCINDLVGVLALPATWGRGEPVQIARTTLDALAGMLGLDVVYVRLSDGSGDGSVELVRVDASSAAPAAARAIGAQLERCLGPAVAAWPPVARIAVDGVEVSVTALPLGLEGEIGVLVAGARRADFPQETERLVLRVAANQAAIGLQEARRQADQERARAHLELGVRGSNLGIFDFDLVDGDLGRSPLTLINFWEPLGYDPAAMPATFLAAAPMVLHPDEVAAVGARMQEAIDGPAGRLELEHRIRHRDGSWQWRLARGVVLRRADGTARRLIGTSVDITGLKHVEEELQLARRAAEAANRAKDAFLANVSHEIRTPMNAILGMTELAMDAAGDQHQHQLLATVKSAARNLLGIINDLLDFSRIAAGKLSLDPHDFYLREALGDALRALAPRAHRKGLELICHVRSDVPDALVGDASRLRQVILNLVGNAIKFTASGEVALEVALGFLATADGPVVLRFTVRDTGIGIAPDKQAAVFRAFEQEDSSTTRRFGGTGLGLTISAQLVALMGGGIGVTSEPGRGSTFTFQACFPRSTRPAPDAHAGSRERLEGLRVLVVDGNDSNRRILTEWLTGWRMRPTAVASAGSALDALDHAARSGAPCALVLLDSRMRDGDGVSLAAAIRERFGPEVRLALLSSEDSPGLLARSREVGVLAYLLKPVQESELLEAIAAVMTTPEIRRGPAAAPRPSAALAAGAGLRVLVAEDNELNAALLRELLAARGHLAHVVGDGRAALAAALDGGSDVLLLDLHMPEMDGFEVVAAIRAGERATGRRLPIIALTARSASRDRARCLDAGMDDFLAKPVDRDELWAAIEGATASPPVAPAPRLLDTRAIRRACGGRQAALDTLREVFRGCLPDHVARCRAALDGGDLARLGDAAHMLVGTLGAFSTIGAAAASALHDAARRGDRHGCATLVARLEADCAELLVEVGALAMERLTVGAP